MPTGKQIRAARVFLDWDADELAKRANVGRDTVLSVETSKAGNKKKSRSHHLDTLTKITNVLKLNNIEFLENDGIRLKDDTLRVIEEGDPYLQVLDAIFYTLKTGEEVLFAFVCNKLSPPKVIESDLRLRKAGIKFRSLIEEGDTYCLYPLKEYKWQPRKFFQNSTQVIYGNKVASMIGGNKSAVIVHNHDYAETQRKLFNSLWENCKGPTHSTSPKKYE